MTDTPNTPPTAQDAPAWRDQLTRFFTWIRLSGLNRDRDRWLLGVCGAIARRTGLDPLIVRGIAIVLAIVGGPAFFAYALGWALLPDTSGRIHVEEAVRGRFTAPTVTSVVLLVATAFSFAQGFHWGGLNTGWILPSWLAVFFSLAWSIAITVGIVWLVIYIVRRGKDQRPGGPGSRANAPDGVPEASHDTATGPGRNAFAGSAPTGSVALRPEMLGTAVAAPPSTSTSSNWEQTASGWQPTEQYRRGQEQQRVRRDEQQARRAERAAARHASLPGAGFTAIVLGLALAAGAVTAGIIASGTTTAPSPSALPIGLAVALGVMAIGVIVSGIRGRRGGALSGLALLAGVSLVAVGIFPAGTDFVAAGDPTWRIAAASSSDYHPGYALGAGQATIDLGLLEDDRLVDDRIIDVWVGLGDTRILLPASTPVRVQSHAVVGGVTTLNSAGGQEQSGLFLNETRTFNGGTNVTLPLIRVWSSIGQVTIIEPDSTTSR
ncbi:hypothetical protein JF66_15100 [Cryobacterium sp. MLB-32]|uniref:PspC domain-containing protein n=1 Tax=Cryobacterium sp. MLB-32 TaxID=1529318 RepID=UPI0004E7AA2C|nr:PspC domain-containing protein [Cryobacterium sp. MLB-32]KFF58911.1 hypothetical protein JF66_15100 [Cryobacterium sp. MLB-32]